MLLMTSEHRPEILFTRDDILATIKRLAQDISQEYRDKHPIIISILKGSFVFTADLIRLMDFPLEVEFIRLSSYGKRKVSSEKVKMVQGLHFPIKGRHVLVVEDIVDSGITIAFLMDYLRRKKPASLKLCSLMDKPARRKVPVNVDYCGFTVPDKFIVGYGVDWDEKFRYLPDICFIEAEE